jgi:hypothetical protein
MKVFDCKTLLFLFLISTAFAVNAAAQCDALENDRSRLFIAYEKTAKVRVDGAPRTDGVILRLHNYTGCDIEIVAAGAEKFYKPLPPNPTVRQRINREWHSDLPDGVSVPEMRYFFVTADRSGQNFGGCVMFSFTLTSEKTILFEAALEHFDLRPESKIAVNIRPILGREKGKISYGKQLSIEFAGSSLPEDVQQKIKLSGK